MCLRESISWANVTIGYFVLDFPSEIVHYVGHLNTNLQFGTHFVENKRKMIKVLTLYKQIVKDTLY